MNVYPANPPNIDLSIKKPVAEQLAVDISEEMNARIAADNVLNNAIVAIIDSLAYHNETAGNAETADYATTAGTADYATTAGTADYATTAGNAETADYATTAGSADIATNAGNAETADYATNAGTAGNAETAGTADYATNAGTADYATNAGTAGNAGTAETATKLANARTINGVSFDGSADITIADSTKAPLASPAFTGTPTAPTPATETNDTQIATTAWVTDKVNYLAAPSINISTDTQIMDSVPIGGRILYRKLSEYNGTPVVLTPPSGATFEGMPRLSLYGQYSFVALERISETVFALVDFSDSCSTGTWY